jgi:putative ATPase
MTRSLFQQEPAYQPLAARMRPASIDEYIGQEHILSPGKPLYEAIRGGQPHSMILWGPPGTGKTTLARLVASSADAHLESLSAVLSGVKEIRLAIDRAKEERAMRGRQTILFVDEVHRFNKSQQDAFLPWIEDGTILFIGATTENPSFELNNALLSRARVYVLKNLDDAALVRILDLALSDKERGFGDRRIALADEQKHRFAVAADGDARKLLNLLELAGDLLQQDAEGTERLTDEDLAQILQGNLRRFDKGGDAFYEQISVLHKAVRGSSPDAALYWFCRMVDGGCDPLYIARRVVRMASEDIGNADPRGLTLALNAWDVQERLGSPEGELAIAQAILYLACAPKSNAVYTAFNTAMADVTNSPAHEVPMHLRNAPTNLMKDLSYGSGYRYAHDEPGAYAAGENYFPEARADTRYYFPTDRGLEDKMRQKLEYLRSLDAASAEQRYGKPGSKP